MKIFIITDNLAKGGKERRLLELLRYYDQFEHQITLVILKDQIEYPVVHQLKNTNLVILKRKIKKDPFVFLQLYKLCRKFKPDVIHSWGSMPSIYMLPAKILMRIPFINAMIVNAKCDGSERIRSWLSFPFSNIILANSYAGLKAYKAPKRKGKVIYNGFNFDRIEHLETPDTIRAKYGISTRYVIGMVAAFHPRKDFETFLSVAASVTKERNDITFLAIGDGALRQQLESRYQSNPHIIFTGNVNGVESLINVFDLGVLLSNSMNHLEGISNSILEMMALGKPVIASRGGGTDEIVIDGKTGLLIEPFDAKALYSGLINLIDDPKERDRLGIEARNFVHEKFSIRQMCENTLQLYKSLVKDESTVN